MVRGHREDGPRCPSGQVGPALTGGTPRGSGAYVPAQNASAPVGLGVTALTSEPADLRDGHSHVAALLECRFHVVDLERFDDCGDQLHVACPFVSCCSEIVPARWD